MTEQRSVKTRRLIYAYNEETGLWEYCTIIDGRLQVNATIDLDEMNLNVTAKNVKSYVDIASIGLGDYTGIDPPDPPASITLLTAAQIRALFDQDVTSTYQMDENEGLITMFKMPNYVYDLEVIGADGYELEGNFYPIYTDNRATVVSKAATSLKVEAKLSGFIFISRNSVTYTISKIIVREMTDARANAPQWQPLNIKKISEVVLDDIDLDDSEIMIDNVTTTLAENLDVAKSLFDKNFKTGVPLFEGISLRFKRAMKIDFIKFISNVGAAIIVTNGVDQWQYQVVFTDGTNFQEQDTIARRMEDEFNKQVIELQFQIQPGGQFTLGELLITLYDTTRVSSSPADPVNITGPVDQAGSTNQFYSDEILNVIPVLPATLILPFGFTAKHFRIISTFGPEIEYRYDGAGNFKYLRPNEAIEDNWISHTSVEIRRTGAGAVAKRYRVDAW